MNSGHPRIRKRRRISKDYADQLISKTDLPKLVGEFISLQQVTHFEFCGSGCPNCGGGTFVVQSELGISYCNNCDWSGSALSFLMDLKNINYIDAIEELERRMLLNMGGMELMD